MRIIKLLIIFLYQVELSVMKKQSRVMSPHSCNFFQSNSRLPENYVLQIVICVQETLTSSPRYV